MFKSEADHRREIILEEERQKLIDHYLQIALTRHETAESEYGFLNVRGQEVPDPTVVEPPLGYIQQPDLMELMRRMVRTELSRVADENEFETFEEADDFDIDDDPVDLASPYEEFFDPQPGAPAGPAADPAGLGDPNAPPASESPPQPAEPLQPGKPLPSS